MKIAFFGAGLMGSGFVRRAIANGWQVNVWNRSPAKAQTLAALGATPCADPAVALQGAERIHLSLADDASVDGVLEPLAGAIGERCWIVDHTTTAVRPTAGRAARRAARGRAYCTPRCSWGPATASKAAG